MNDYLSLGMAGALALAGQASRPLDLFDRSSIAEGSNCGYVGDPSIKDENIGYVVASCMPDISETKLFAEGGRKPGEPIVIWILEPAPATLARDLARSLAKHAPGGMLGSHPVRVERTKESALGKLMASCADKLQPGHFELSVEELVPLTASCVKGMKGLKLTELRFENGRIKARSAADPATVESLRGAVNSVSEGQIGLQLVFVDLLP